MPKDFNWNNIMGVWLIILVSTALTITAYSLFQNHRVTHYYLASNAIRNTSEHELCITGNVEWGLDRELILDRNVDYAEAIKLCFEMNKKLKH